MAVDFLLRPLPVCAIESGEGEARKCETSKLSVIQRVQFLHLGLIKSAEFAPSLLKLTTKLALASRNRSTLQQY